MLDLYIGSCYLHDTFSMASSTCSPHQIISVESCTYQKRLLESLLCEPSTHLKSIVVVLL